MIKVLINGISGNMGYELCKQIEKSSDFRVLCGICRKKSKNFSCPIYSNVNYLKEKPNVIIDFSTPKATLNILNYAYKFKIPIVIATTGFLENDLNIIKRASFRIPIFMSSNMSYMINVMADISCILANKLNNSDIEILEFHHNQKKDAPSGTALYLANCINNSLNNNMNYEYNRHSLNRKREKNEIGIHSIRGGSEIRKTYYYLFRRK